jgi:hypothetical protein
MAEQLEGRVEVLQPKLFGHVTAGVTAQVVAFGAVAGRASKPGDEDRLGDDDDARNACRLIAASRCGHDDVA